MSDPYCIAAKNVIKKAINMTNTTENLDCGEQLTITQLESWYVQCLKILLAGNNVFIDVSRLQRIDTAALQLLYRFQQQAEKYDIQVHWSVMSDSFQDAVSLSGLSFKMTDQPSVADNDSMENN